MKKDDGWEASSWSMVRSTVPKNKDGKPQLLLGGKLVHLSVSQTSGFGFAPMFQPGVRYRWSVRSMSTSCDGDAGSLEEAKKLALAASEPILKLERR